MSATRKEQLSCAERELARRKAKYPAMIEGKRLDPKVAEAEIAAMEAIVGALTTLVALEEIATEMKEAYRKRALAAEVKA